jgi:putative tricarboxylic transport membrane protein
VKVLELPRPALYTGILMFGTLGVYSLSNSVTEVLIMFAIGLLGFVLRRSEFPIAPVILGVILGPLMEAQFRRTLIVSDGDLGALFSRPLSLVLMALAVLAIGLPYLPALLARLRGRHAGRLVLAEED